MNRRLLRSLVVVVAGTMAASSAQAQTCSIGTTQYDQLRFRLLGTSGTLTQGYCTVNSVNVNSCANTADNTKHTGIDYAAALGTPVYAPVGGVVKRAEPGTCSGGTCTLSTLAIYNSRSGVTSVFLHMESILVSLNAEVVSGQQVGTVGKRGALGYHLHYEVRSGSQTAGALCVTSTVNPFQYTPFVWDFNVNNNLEGWTGTNLSSIQANSQVLSLNPAGLDPYVTSPTVKADAGTFKHVKLRLASNALDSSGAIYFKTSTSTSFTESKKVAFTVTGVCPLCGNASYQDYEVNMAGNANWTGTITGLRLDPANAGQSGTSLDSIGLQYLMLWP